MLNKRCGVAESRAKMMVAVMRELQRRRKNANILAGKYGFITPRDLFRWAERHRDAETSSMDSCAIAGIVLLRCASHVTRHTPHVTCHSSHVTGFMLLGEALRNSEDKSTVADVLSSVMLKGKRIDTRPCTIAIGSRISNLSVKYSASSLWALKFQVHCRRAIQQLLLLKTLFPG